MQALPYIKFAAWIKCHSDRKSSSGFVKFIAFYAEIQCRRNKARMPDILFPQIFRRSCKDAGADDRARLRRIMYQEKCMKVTNLYNSNIQNSLRVDDAGSAAAELKSGDILEGLVTSSGKSTKVEFAQLNNKEVTFDSKSVRPQCRPPRGCGRACSSCGSRPGWRLWRAG